MFKIFRFNSFFFKILLSGITFLSSANLCANNLLTDSTKHAQHLSTVTVNGNHLQTVRATLPLQTLTSKELSGLNAYNIADVAKHFAGVTVKDYGGIGGLKTISVRGLGALHTGVSYDGILMSDVQSGQIDLSRFSIENISEVSLSNGQPNNLLQPARMFASSSVLNFSTKFPDYDSTHTFSGNIIAKVGSFGLINPVLLLNKNFSKKWVINLSANALTANGVYPFQSNLNLMGSNWVQKNRINSDVRSLRSELNTAYQFSKFEVLKIKINQYNSERGLPGSDTYYLSYATERLMDNNAMAQFQYQNRNNCYVQYQFSGKINTAKMRYTEQDPKFELLTNHTRIDNYLQNEYYLSSALQLYALNNLTFSTSIDWCYNDLFSNSNIGFRTDATPTRHTGLANIAGKYCTDRLILSANILYTLTRETTQSGLNAPNRNKLSPTFCLSYKLLKNKEFRVRAFYKNIFRLPTFNDLYYHDFGFTLLQPETTNQFNAGLNYYDTDISFLSEFECSVDAYYNRVTDKISTVYGMPFSTVRNIGIVNIKGCDVNLKLSKTVNTKSSICLNANYSYQLAQDYTVGTESYLDIMPYTPIHSSSGSLSFKHKIWELGYNYLFAGKRYAGNNDYKQNLMKPYIDQSLFARIRINRFSLLGEIINLTNKNYEIVKFYPMPGRNFRFTLNYKF